MHISHVVIKKKPNNTVVAPKALSPPFDKNIFFHSVVKSIKFIYRTLHKHYTNIYTCIYIHVDKLPKDLYYYWFLSCILRTSIHEMAFPGLWISDTFRKVTFIVIEYHNHDVYMMYTY